MKVRILEKLDDNTYLVMSDDGQTAIATEQDIKNLKKVGNLDDTYLEQKEM
jgi:3-polyprenyl-4-hydroxybenzoate decarboxylase